MLVSWNARFIFLYIHVQKGRSRFGIKLPNNVIVHEPFSYLQMIGALNNCKYVLTDSGGLQKEAFYFGKKAAFICHFDTFQQDLVDLDALITVSPHEDLKACETWLNTPLMVKGNPYGDGFASKMILDTILAKL